MFTFIVGSSKPAFYPTVDGKQVSSPNEILNSKKRNRDRYYEMKYAIVDDDCDLHSRGTSKSRFTPRKRLRNVRGWSNDVFNA